MQKNKEKKKFAIFSVYEMKDGFGFCSQKRSGKKKKGKREKENKKNECCINEK